MSNSHEHLRSKSQARATRHIKTENTFCHFERKILRFLMNDRHLPQRGNFDSASLPKRFYENKHQHTQHDSVSKNLKTDSAECSK